MVFVCTRMFLGVGIRDLKIYTFTIGGGPIIDSLTAILLETVFIYFCKKNNFKI